LGCKLALPVYHVKLEKLICRNPNQAGKSMILAESASISPPNRMSIAVHLEAFDSGQGVGDN
jgi:hypothetical protein